MNCGTGWDMWDPGQYLRHRNIQTRYILDLLAQVSAVRPRHIVDLGCGPGNATELLARRWPGAHVLGLDNSPAMLEAARKLARPRRLLRRGSLEFRHGDIRDWTPGDLVDVLLASAVLQWIPSHRKLLRRFAGFLAPGGFLAYQMPVEFGQADRILFGLCTEDRWHGKLADVPGLRPVDTPAEYLITMTGAGLRADTWETTYTTVITDCTGDRDGIVEYLKSTSLRPVLQRLSQAETTQFLAEFAARIRDAYSPAPLAGQMVRIVSARRTFGIGRKPP
ncbi:MAG: methyltransferase domain-containing protein [Streptosporangiaceae bacterium]|nr:methyltransferase domain-containing protein [Streptosporangiaceae bacterium]MBV9854919.1 methyltransferase domain-containing protein [Streptosporangiaceae bacterium]